MPDLVPGPGLSLADVILPAGIVVAAAAVIGG
jgi:hypothetical protein